MLLRTWNIERTSGHRTPDLLSSCPETTILVTSRAPLRVNGEYRYPISPLAIPPRISGQFPRELAEYSGAALFLDRASRVRRGFTLTAENATTVAAICARLDGLPLAIELAAAWLGALSAEALLERLEYRLPLLTGGNRDLPDRQRTMRDAVAWSYDLLSDEEQRCFRRLAVFLGRFSLEAAEKVAGSGDRVPTGEGVVSSPFLTPPPSPVSFVLELVAALAEKSLLVQAPDSGGRTPLHHA